MSSRSQRPAVPSPALMRGRTDPKHDVTPVDWTATGARPEEPPVQPSPPAPRHRARTIRLDLTDTAPPEDALHTLDHDDPRPVPPRPLRIDESLIRIVGAKELSTRRIVAVVAEPTEAWTSDHGTSDHFLRGDLVVQVRRADNTVIGAFSRAYALAVRPDDVRWDEEIADLAAGRSTRGGGGTRVPTTRRELLDALEDRGFEVRPGKGHGKLVHPDHPGLFVPMPTTPSDVRFTRNAVSQIKRVFGVDLRR